MATSLTRKVERLEAEFWSKAEPIDIEAEDRAFDILHKIYPLDVRVLNHLEIGSEEKRLDQLLTRLTHSLPPIHPAFLPDEQESTRTVQWGLHRSDEYRETYTRIWTGIADFLSEYFEGKNIIEAVLVIGKQDIDRWIQETGYAGYQESREELAINIVEFWRVIRREYTFGDSLEDEAWKDLWRRASIEQERVVYGRNITAEEYEREQGMWNQLCEDMGTGKPSSESEVAHYLRNIHEEFPRKPQFRRPAE